MPSREMMYGRAASRRRGFGASLSDERVGATTCTLRETRISARSGMTRGHPAVRACSPHGDVSRVLPTPILPASGTMFSRIAAMKHSVTASRLMSFGLIASALAGGCGDPAFTSDRGDSIHRYHVMPAAGGPARVIPLELDVSPIQPLAWSAAVSDS